MGTRREKVFQIYLGNEIPEIKQLPIELLKKAKPTIAEVFEEQNSEAAEHLPPINFDVPFMNLKKKRIYVKEAFDIKNVEGEFVPEFIGAVQLKVNDFFDEPWIGKHRGKWQKKAKDGDFAKPGKKYAMDLHVPAQKVIPKQKPDLSDEEQKVEGLRRQSTLHDSRRTIGEPRDSVVVASLVHDVSQRTRFSESTNLASLDLYLSSGLCRKMQQNLDYLQEGTQPEPAQPKEKNRKLSP